jgi:hypothetical protein
MSSVSRTLAQPIPYFFAAAGAVQGGEALIFNESTSVPGTGSFVAAGGALSVAISLGGLMKDMGRTVVSAGRTFRKVALLSAGFSQTEGVVGIDSNYEAVYVELGLPTFGTSQTSAPAGILRYF